MTKLRSLFVAFLMALASAAPGPLAAQATDNPSVTLEAHANRGKAFREMGRYADAEREYGLALDAARALGSDGQQARILLNLASVQALGGQLGRADATARLGLRISQRSAEGWEPFLWGVRAQIALARGDLGAARGHLERNIAASTSAASMASRLEATNQELRIAQLRAGQLQREDRLKLFGLIGVVALAALAVGFVALRAIRRRHNRVVDTNATLSHAVRHDALTGLPNRNYVRELLHERLNGRSEGACALMLIDLDRFKAVNDTLGHEAGDAVLRQVANRLSALLPKGAHAGRLGGDEFAALLPGKSNVALDRIAGDVVDALSQTYEIDGTTASISASIGIAMGGSEGTTVDIVTRNADLALYYSKHTGRERFTFFEPWMLMEADERRRIETDLRTALINEQFAVAYQPIVDADRGEIVAFEALVRWRHPVRGEIPSSQFIAVAEEAGLIRQIGDWVLRTACAEAARWPERIKLAVNLSVVQVEAEGLLSSVVSALAHSGLPPERLEFEVNESVFLREGRATGRTLEALRSLGVSLALDDFGTGYSSLGYLQRTDFSKIKIDRSFIRSAADGNEDSLVIIRAVVAMARGLGMATTAEGVETEAERRLVHELGCSEIQGYLVGRPEVRIDLAGDACGERSDTNVTPINVPPARRRRSRAA